jgi:hypothetical protein
VRQRRDLSPLFTWRLAIASKDSDLPPTVRLAAHTLALHMNTDGGSCFPSIATLAAESGLSERSVQKAIRHLEDAGWLRVRLGGSPRGGRRRANTYQATFSNSYLEKEAGEAQEDGNHRPLNELPWSPSGPVNVATATGERSSPQDVKRGRKERPEHQTKAERVETHRKLEHWLETLGVGYAVDLSVFHEEIAKLGVDPDYAEELRLALIAKADAVAAEAA